MGTSGGGGGVQRRDDGSASGRSGGRDVGATVNRDNHGLRDLLIRCERYVPMTEVESWTTMMFNDAREWAEATVANRTAPREPEHVGRWS